MSGKDSELTDTLNEPSGPYRVRPVDDFDDVLDVDVVLLGVQSHGEAVVLPAVDRLVPHRQHLPVHVQHLTDTQDSC